MARLNELAGVKPASAVPSFPKPPEYVGGRSEANSSGSTVGRLTYSGLYRSILNEMGRPDTSAIFTPVQSSSVGFSTIAHPCRYGLAFSDIRRRYEVFQIGASTT